MLKIRKSAELREAAVAEHVVLSFHGSGGSIAVTANHGDLRSSSKCMPSIVRF
jgi:hypothetical protein